MATSGSGGGGGNNSNLNSNSNTNGLPIYSDWKTLPKHLATRTTLAKEGKKPSGPAVALFHSYYVRQLVGVYQLYDRNLALDKPVQSAAQKAGVARAQATRERKARTCVSCQKWFDQSLPLPVGSNADFGLVGMSPMAMAMATVPQGATTGTTSTSSVSMPNIGEQAQRQGQGQAKVRMCVECRRAAHVTELAKHRRQAIRWATSLIKGTSPEQWCVVAVKATPRNVASNSNGSDNRATTGSGDTVGSEIMQRQRQRQRQRQLAVIDGAGRTLVNTTYYTYTYAKEKTNADADADADGVSVASSVASFGHVYRAICESLAGRKVVAYDAAEVCGIISEECQRLGVASQQCFDLEPEVGAGVGAGVGATTSVVMYQQSYRNRQPHRLAPDPAVKEWHCAKEAYARYVGEVQWHWNTKTGKPLAWSFRLQSLPLPLPLPIQPVPDDLPMLVSGVADTDALEECQAVLALLRKMATVTATANKPK